MGSAQIPPLVTVLMPVFNGEKFVLDAVNSILQQSFEDFEFLIVDDGSTDSTSKLLNNFNDCRLRVVTNDRNIGLIASLNLGLKEARGRYIARMDADDIAMPERLSIQVNYLQSNPQVAVLGGMADLINVSGIRFSSLKYPTDPVVIRKFLLQECCLIHPTIMFRTDVVRIVGGYSAYAKNVEDYDLWLRLSDSHALANLPDILIKYRVHLGQASITNLVAKYKTEQVCREEAVLRREALGENVSSAWAIIRPNPFRRWTAQPCTLGRDHLSWYQQYSLLKDHKRALIFALQAVRHSPLSSEAWLSVCAGGFRALTPYPWQKAFRWYWVRAKDFLRKKR